MSDSRRRWLWLALAAALAALLVVPFAPAARQVTFDRRLSTLRTTPDGAGALYETLDELGIRVERRRTPLAGADPLGAPLALLAPTIPLTPHELDALFEWVGAGGDAIVAVWPYDALSARLGLEAEYIRWDADGKARPDSLRRARPTDHGWVKGTGSVGPVSWAVVDSGQVEKNDSAVARPAEWTPLLTEAMTGRPVALIVHRGRGRILVIAEPGLLENERIGDSGIMPMFARAAVDMTRAGEPLVFDEYHHGHRGGTVAGAAWTFLTRRPAGRAVLQLVVVALLSLLPLALRLGAARDEPPAARRSPLEHVSALGAVYRQAGAAAIARRRLLSGFARRIGREQPPAGRESEFLHRLEQRVPVGAPAVVAVASAWSDPRTDLVELSQRIDRAVQSLRKQERHGT